MTVLRKQNKALRDQNASLQSRIERLLDEDDVSIQPKRGAKGGPSEKELKAKVKKLTDEVSKLKAVRSISCSTMFAN